MTALAIGFPSSRPRERGHVLFIALIFVLISLGFASSYLRFVMGERMIYLQRAAKIRAKYNAYSGLAMEAVPFLTSPNFTSTDTLLDEVATEIPMMFGGFDSIQAKIDHTVLVGRKYFTGIARGTSTFPTWSGNEFEVEYWASADFRPRGFEEFMYLTNEETPGGGPWLGSYVSFGANDQLEGIVFSNDNLTMSSFGCPQFLNSETEGEPAQIYTAGNFIMNGCPESIFGPNGDMDAIFADSVPPIAWPPYAGHDRVKENANWIFHGDSKIHLNGSDPDAADTLIMTRVVFEPGQFTVKRWPYVIPPLDEPSPFHPSYAQFLDTLKRFYPMYYRDHFNDIGAYTGDIEFQHFFFPEPANLNDLIENRTIVADEGVIWIEGGQVQVKGVIEGRYTLATSRGTLYRMHHDNETITELKNNIWIIDDLRYNDMNILGRIPRGSLNRMGLLSGGNVVIANTPANGARNRAWGQNIIIHAAIIAMDESFLVHYWSNTTDYGGITGGQIKGDGRTREMWAYYIGNPNLNPGGTADIRGQIKLHGSIIQEKRGYVKRNNPGPYPISPGIGYDKDYHYDFNLRAFPPPHWPETRNEDGSANLVLDAFGEYKR